MFIFIMFYLIQYEIIDSLTEECVNIFSKKSKVD